MRFCKITVPNVVGYLNEGQVSHGTKEMSLGQVSGLSVPRLHRQHRETRSFHVTRHDSGRRRPVSSPSQEESILNVVADRPESSTRAIFHHVSVTQQAVCKVLNENPLHIFHFQRVLKPAEYLLRLPVGGTAVYATARHHSSCAEQLL
ncbi:hypothetical protein TNCV_79341 [Trichonephila clavipes]|nr:hypothetical protein TNCV_79341 [Trichonephila clavipes]